MKKILTALTAALVATGYNAPPIEQATGTRLGTPGETLELGEDRADRMTVPVSINGEGPFEFVIDTGAERTMISHELAEKLSLETEGYGRIHTISGEFRVPVYPIDEVRISQDGAKAFLAPAVARSRLGGDGLLGIDSLQNSKVVLDMRREEMHVMPSEVRERPRRSVSRDVIVITAERLHGRLILTRAVLDRVPVKVILDTGAQVSVGNEALRQALLRREREDREVRLIGVTGAALVGQMGQIRRLEVGGMTIAGGPIAFGDAPVFEQIGLDDEPAILLGMSQLRAFEAVEVDFANREVAFDMPRRASGMGIERYGCSLIKQRTGRC